MTETANETPPYLESARPESFKSKPQKKIESLDLFKKSEKSNWVYSEMAGIINNVMRTGAKTLGEIAKALEDQKVFDSAVKEGRDLAARTQFSPDAAFRPLAYDRTLFRTFAMFTRYPIGATELFIKTMFGKLEGAEGVRAQNILRRGMTEDAKPVEFLRSTQFIIQSLESALKESKKGNYKLDVEAKNVNQFIKFLKEKETELNKVVKGLEPIKRGRSAKKWAKYIGINMSISFAYRVFENMLYQSLGSKKDKDIGKMIFESIADASPLPMYRFNPADAFSAPILPDLNFFTYGNFTPARGIRDLINYGANLTPYLNIANQNLRRFTGKSIGNYLIPSGNPSYSRTR